MLGVMKTTVVFRDGLVFHFWWCSVAFLDVPFWNTKTLLGSPRKMMGFFIFRFWNTTEQRGGVLDVPFWNTKSPKIPWCAGVPFLEHQGAL